MSASSKRRCSHDEAAVAGRPQTWVPATFFAALSVAMVGFARDGRAEEIEGWPCEGCTTVVPSGLDAGAGDRHPLIVALHGDGGAIRPMVRAWKAAAEEASAILLVPSCPRSLGCKALSYWQWQASSQHDPAWLGAQIDAVAARFPVDPKRVVAAGYSGGATYLGWYAPTFPTRFGAVAHIAGGAPYRPPCPACKVPVLFLLGKADPMLEPYTRPLRDWYESCGGHEIVWETLPGVTHESIVSVLQAGRARAVLSWLLARPLACDQGPDAGALVASDASVIPAVDASAATQATATPALHVPPREPPAPARCACGFASIGPRPAWAATGALLVVAGRRRRRRSVPRTRATVELD